MSRPIATGDKCEVISALGRHKSPNIGLEVLVVSNQGEHSRHGRVVRCEHPELCQLDDAGSYKKFGWADLATAWLRRIDEPGLLKTETTERGVTA